MNYFSPVFHLFSLLFLACTVTVTAQTKFEISHGPYLTNMTQTGVSILWTTTDPALSWVEMAPDDGTPFHATERPRFYQVKNGRRVVNTTLHHVHLADLPPGTTYRYRVCSRELVNWNSQHEVSYGRIIGSDWEGRKRKFTTFAKNPADISFLMLNDIHGDTALIRKLCRNIDFRSLDMIVLNGDMTSYLDSEEQIFQEYMDALIALGASEVPIVFTRGNHENRGIYTSELGTYFPTPTGHFYYYFSVGDVLFIALDCGEDKPDSSLEYNGLADYDAYREEQARWFKAVMQTDSFQNARRKIAILHIPLTGDDLWHGNLHLRQTLLPLLNNSNLDLMLSGHTHRFSYHPAETEVRFPTLVNSNDTYTLCKISNGHIQLEVIGLNGLVKKIGLSN